MANKRKLNFEWGDKNYHTPFGERDKPYAPGVPMLQGTYRGARNRKTTGPSHHFIHGEVEAKRGGWYRALVSVDGKPVYTGPQTRDRTAAWSEVRDAISFFRSGVDA